MAKGFLRLPVVLALSLTLSAAPADLHVVPLGEIQRQLPEARDARQRNYAKVESMLALPPVEKALRTAGVDVKAARAAAAFLSDAELARLAERADRVQKDIAAGALSNQELTYIVIALATAVLVLIIVKA